MVYSIDLGLVFNALTIPAFFFAFWAALCMKFDGYTDTSLFILLIPLWVITVPLIIFTILNGLAARNTRANKCEKVMLSSFVPGKNNYMFYNTSL